VEELKDNINLDNLNDKEQTALANLMKPKKFVEAFTPYILEGYQEQLITMAEKYPFTGFVFPRQCLDGNTYVLTKKNKYKKIKNVFASFKNGHQMTYKVKTDNHKQIICTEDHAFFTNHGWVELKDINIKDDFIYSPPILNVDLKSNFTNSELYLFAAFFVGKLFISGKNIRGKFIDDIDTIIHHINKVTKGNVIIEKYRSTCIDVLPKKNHKKNDLFVWYNKFKRQDNVPEVITMLSSKQLKKFVRYLLDISSLVNTLRYYTLIKFIKKCPEEIVKYIFHRIGVRARKRKNDNTVEIYGIMDNIILYSASGVKSEKEKNYLKHLLLKNDMFKQPYSEWVKIKSIEKHRKMLVYDMEVEPEHWYIANGLKVHNCGKSFSCSILAIRQLLFNKDQAIYVIAPIKDQARDLFSKIKNIIAGSEVLSSYLEITNTEIRKKRKKDVGFIKWLSASPGSKITGKTATLIIIDESQDITDAKLENDIYPFAAHYGAPIVQVGTPRGRNHFYYIFNGKNNYKKLKITHEDVPRIKPEEAAYRAGYTEGYIEQQREIISREAFSMQYESKWVTETNNAFKFDDIISSVCDLVCYDKGFNYVKYYGGLDLGKVNDPSVLTIIAETSDNKIATRFWYDWLNVDYTLFFGLRDRREGEEDILLLPDIIKNFNIEHLYFDATGHGVVIEEMFEQMNEKLNAEGSIELNYEPLTFTLQNKMDMVDNLNKYMQDRKIEIANFYADELKSYIKTKSVRGFKYEGDKGCHDDRTVSVLLAAFSYRNYGSDLVNNKEKDALSFAQSEFFSNHDGPKILKTRRELVGNKCSEKEETDFAYVDMF